MPYLFPSEFTFISSAFLLAPFWSDIDISSPGRGSIKYEVHSGSDDSFLSQVNSFVSNYTGSEFAGTWMLIAYWDQVPQFPSFIATVVHINLAFSNVLHAYMEVSMPSILIEFTDSMVILNIEISGLERLDIPV